MGYKVYQSQNAIPNQNMRNSIVVNLEIFTENSSSYINHKSLLLLQGHILVESFNKIL